MEREAFVLFDSETGDVVVALETTNDLRHAYDQLLLFPTKEAAEQYQREQQVPDPVVARAVVRKVRVTVALL